MVSTKPGSYHHAEQIYEKLKQPKELFNFDEPGHLNARWIGEGRIKKLLEKRMTHLIDSFKHPGLAK